MESGRAALAPSGRLSAGGPRATVRTGAGTTRAMPGSGVSARGRWTRPRPLAVLAAAQEPEPEAKAKEHEGPCDGLGCDVGHRVKGSPVGIEAVPMNHHGSVRELMDVESAPVGERVRVVPHLPLRLSESEAREARP